MSENPPGNDPVMSFAKHFLIICISCFVAMLSLKYTFEAFYLNKRFLN